MEIRTNPAYEREKLMRALYKQMEYGEITEDEMNEQLEQFQNDIKAMEDGSFHKKIDEQYPSDEKKKSQRYTDYFHNNKKEFRNILGM